MPVARVTAPACPTLLHPLMSEIIVPRGWRERVETIAGSRRDAIVIVTLVAIVSMGGLLLWSRGGDQIAPPARSSGSEEVALDDVAQAPAAPSEAQGVAVGSETGGTVPGVILVHVSGAVRRPGLYELGAGARVADAIDTAGGPHRKADLSLLNLAQPLSDGTKLDVPRRGNGIPGALGTPAGESAVPPTPPPSGAVPGAASPSALIPLNSADQVALETIPGVGPVTAAAILEYREQVGGFSSIEQLLEVSGIGPATLEEIRPYVTI
jgi:competence protein ComEA